MSAGIFKKIGMTRLFINDNAVVTTVIELQPSYVLERKTLESHGYNSVQIGAVFQNRSSKAELGHIKKYQPTLEKNLRIIKEFKISLPEDKTEIAISDFVVGDRLDITGKVIGRGTAGVVKRWNFAGQPQTHGHDHPRAVGSMGGRWPQRVVKGKKMAGHYGDQYLTLRGMHILAIDEEQNLLFIKGSLPGANSSYLTAVKK